MRSTLRHPFNLIVASLVLTIAVWIWSPWRSRFGHHFRAPLPPTARMVNYHHSWGRDSGDEFEFAVTDDALRDAIIKAWSLQPATRPDDVMSFAKFTGAPLVAAGEPGPISRAVGAGRCGEGEVLEPAGRSRQWKVVRGIRQLVMPAP